MLPTTIGALMLIVGGIALMPGIVDGVYRLLSRPYLNGYAFFVGHQRAERFYERSRRPARIWMPAFFFLLGVVLILSGSLR